MERENMKAVTATPARRTGWRSVLPLAAAIAIVALPQAHARPGFLNTFNALYGTDGTAIDRCGMCHIDFGGGGPRNPYGQAFEAQGTFDAAALQAIETQNSDGDAVDNITEINAGFFPGWDCTNYLDSTGIIKAELALLVDPDDVGCASNPPPTDGGGAVAVGGAAGAATRRDLAGRPQCRVVAGGRAVRKA